MRKIIEKIGVRLLRILLSVKVKLGMQYSQFVLRSGEKFVIRNVDSLGFDLINGEKFENATRDLLRQTIQEGMTVLDVGANIGYYSVQMASLVGNTGKVYAFEPNPAMIEELNRNIKLNQLTNVEVVPVALANAKGRMPFYNPKTGWEGHGSLKQNSTFNAQNVIEIVASRLDDVMMEKSIHKVDFIKIDVEGAELGVIQGAFRLLSSDKKPVIIFEAAENLCNEFGHTVFDTLKLISDCGYEIRNIDWGNWLAKPKN